MKPFPILSLCGLLLLGAACSEAESKSSPDPDAPVGKPSGLGEKDPVVDENPSKAPPTETTGQNGETPTWIVYTIPG